MMKTIDLPPYAPTLMESTRAIGYSLEAAIADIIDNCITASATRIDIDFFPEEEAYISVLDNGSGMTRAEICAAMQYGSKNPNEERDVNDLGRYGLGLKTASLSQCRVLSVLSNRNGKMNGCRWDLDYVQNTGKWSLLVLDKQDMENLPEYEKLKKIKNGTLVIWQRLDRLSMGDINFAQSLSLKMNKVREHIALVFHRYLSGEPGLRKIEFFINNKKVIGIDPFLSKKSTQLFDDEVITVRGQQIIVRPYILPHISKMSDEEIKRLGGKEGLRKEQGFYVYRNKRLLIWGTWFRLMRQGDLSKLARVQIDIPNSLDDLWTLDIKKSTAIPPEEVKKNLSNVIEKISDGSRRTYVYRGKKENNVKIVHFWNRLKTRDGGIIYEVNREHPIINSIIDKSPECKNELYTLLSQIEGNIPLNALYVDLSNDEKLANEATISESDTFDMLKDLLATCVDHNAKSTLLNQLKFAEPFCLYFDVIENSITNGEFI